MGLAHISDLVSPVTLFLIMASGGYIYAVYYFHHKGWWSKLKRRGLIRWWHPWCFGAGIAVLILALFSPIHDLAEEFLYMHMVQHVLLMMPAPLLILFGLPSPILRWLILKAELRNFLTVVTHPMTAFLLFNTNLLTWHVPAFYQATLTNDLIHDFQHALFFYTGLFFYWRLVDPTHGWYPFWEWAPSRWLYLLVAAPPSYILGSILWASNIVYYPYYNQAYFFRFESISAIQDQSYAGMLMWLHGWMFMMASMFVFFLHYEPGLEQARD